MRERRRHKVTSFYYDKRTSNRDMKKYDEMKEEGEGRRVKSSKNIMSNKMKTGKDVKQYNFVDDRKYEGFVAE